MAESAFQPNGQGASLSVGVDLIELSRIREAMARHGDRFLTRVFTAEELIY